MGIKEKGMVVNTKEERLVVKVIRESFSGGGCCGASGSETVFVEARNSCGAVIGDTVNLDGSIEREAAFQALRVGIYTGAFLAGLITGEYFAPRFGLEQWKEAVSFSLGFILAALAFLLGKFFRGKKSHPDPAAIEILHRGYGDGIRAFTS
jgi:hypothetical protein